MKSLYILLLGLLLANLGSAQSAQTSENTERYKPFSASLVGVNESVRIDTLIRFQERKSNLHQFGEARQALTEALSRAERTHNKDQIANVYLALGQWAGKQNNYSQALQYYQQALSALKGSDRTDAMHLLYVHIGNTYQRTLDPTHAEFYYKKVTNAQTPKASLLNQLYAYGGLANLADQHHDPHKALYYNERAQAAAKRLGRWDDYYNKRVNIAFNYSDLNRPQEAIALYQECMAYVEQIKKQKRANTEFERHFITAIYDGLPYPLITLNRFDEAERYAKLALLYGTQDNGYQKLHHMWVYDALALLYEKKKDYPKALAAHKQWAIYRDSIQNQASTQKFAELETRYQTKEKEDQIKQLDATNAQKTRQLWIGVIGLILLSILFSMLVWQYRRIQRSRTKIQQQSDQLALMMKELHHRVKNNLAIVSSLLNLQAKRLDDEKAVQAVRTGQQRVEAMSLIHQRLYQTDHITAVNIHEYLTDLAKSLMLAYGYAPETFDLNIDVEQQEIDMDVAIPLGLIANELITNAFKYAYTNGERPHLRIALHNNNGLTLEVQDNGPGIAQADWQQPNGRTSFGQRLIGLLSEQLEGQYELLNQNGTLFRLHIPGKWQQAA